MDGFCNACLAKNTALFTLTDREEALLEIATGGQLHVVLVAGSDVYCLPCRLALTGNLVGGGDAA